MTKSKVVLYGASWCQPCTKFKPIFFDVSKGYLSDYVEFEYKDVDQMERSELSMIGIKSVPTVLFYGEGGAIATIKPGTRAMFEQDVEYLAIGNVGTI